MTDRTIVACVDCESVYTVRRREDGTFIMPTTDGSCECGGDAFEGVRTPTG